MKFFSILLVAVSLVGVSCERHEFKETKELHKSHAAGAHGDGGHGEHKDDHAAKPEAHAEEKAHH